MPDLALDALIGPIAGALIIGVGGFILAAKPTSRFHQLFFALALLDGASTLLFGLSNLSDPGPMWYALQSLYWDHFIAFLTMLGVFSVLFPRPIAATRPLVSRVLVIVISLAGIAVLLLHLANHALFWSPVPGNLFGVRIAPLGNVLSIAFVLATILIILRLARAYRTETSPSHRRQAAFMLAGMVLAYLPFPATLTIQVLATVPGVFVEGRLDRMVTYWTFAAASVVGIGIAISILRDREESRREDRRIILAAFAGVGALTAIAYADPAPLVGAATRSVGLLAYPLLLAYALARFEVFDIDRRMRRGATLTLGALLVSGTFIIVQTVVSTVLQNVVFGAIPSGYVSGTLAAFATTALFWPVVRTTQHVVKRFIPELTGNGLDQRRLEIYEHSLTGALADGELSDRENRTLAALRESLGVSETEHQMLVTKILTRDALPVASASAVAG